MTIITYYIFFPRIKDALSFGRPGYGAPVRTRSGHVKTAVMGNTEIRFQEDKSVQKAITNTIRYTRDWDSKAEYGRFLGKKSKIICPLYM